MTTTTTTTISDQQSQLPLLYSPGVFVLGMHRSGTSALAGLLNISGYKTGNGKLVGPFEANPKGYFELRSLVRQDNRWMKASKIRLAKKNHRILINSTKLSKDGRDTLQALDDDGKPWLLKDPRLCHAVHVWAHYIHNHENVNKDNDSNMMSLLPSSLVTIRHPWEVAQSLKRRNNLPHIIAMKHWMWYNQEALYLSIQSQLCIIFTSYMALLHDPIHEMERIISDLTIKCHVMPPTGINKVAVADFLSLDLQHNRVPTNTNNNNDNNLFLNESTRVPNLIGQDCIFEKPQEINNDELAYLIPSLQLFCDVQTGAVLKSDYSFPILPENERQIQYILQHGLMTSAIYESLLHKEGE